MFTGPLVLVFVLFHKTFFCVAEFPQEPYNPEAPGITVPPPPGYWPAGPGLPPPHFMTHPPPPPVTKPPTTRELVTITDVKREIKGN